MGAVLPRRFAQPSSLESSVRQQRPLARLKALILCPAARCVHCTLVRLKQINHALQAMTSNNEHRTCCSQMQQSHQVCPRRAKQPVGGMLLRERHAARCLSLSCVGMLACWQPPLLLSTAASLQTNAICLQSGAD
jgi:hypothetical protein